MERLPADNGLCTSKHVGKSSERSSEANSVAVAADRRLDLCLHCCLEVVQESTAAIALNALPENIFTEGDTREELRKNVILRRTCRVLFRSAVA